MAQSENSAQPVPENECSSMPLPDNHISPHSSKRKSFFQDYRLDVESLRRLLRKSTKNDNQSSAVSPAEGQPRHELTEKELKLFQSAQRREERRQSKVDQRKIQQEMKARKAEAKKQNAYTGGMFWGYDPMAGKTHDAAQHDQPQPTSNQSSSLPQSVPDGDAAADTPTTPKAAEPLVLGASAKKLPWWEEEWGIEVGGPGKEGYYVYKGHRKRNKNCERARSYMEESWRLSRSRTASLQIQ